MHKDTQYGFEWGSVKITRLISDEKKGWIVFGAETAKGRIEVYCTKSGNIRVNHYDNKKKVLVGDSITIPEIKK